MLAANAQHRPGPRLVPAGAGDVYHSILTAPSCPQTPTPTPAVVSLLASEANGTNLTASELVAAVQPALDAVNSVLGALSSVTWFVQQQVLNRITNIINSAYDVTQSVQDTWRYVVIAVLFGITIVIAAVLLGLLIRMGWPKTASAIMALFWLDIAILMLVGVGAGMPVRGWTGGIGGVPNGQDPSLDAGRVRGNGVSRRRGAGSLPTWRPPHDTPVPQPCSGASSCWVRMPACTRRRIWRTR